MDKLTGTNGSNLTETNSFSSTNKTSESVDLNAAKQNRDNSTSFVNETIMSQALEIKDWMQDMKLNHDYAISLDASRQDSGDVIKQYLASRFRPIKKLIRKLSKTKSIEVVRVLNLCNGNPANFRLGWIGSPIRGDKIDGSTILVDGWLVGNGSQPIAINIKVHETTVAQTPVNIPRPDVLKAHFFESTVCNCGYSQLLNVEEFPDETDVLLEAIFPDGRFVSSGLIQFYKYGQ